MKIKKILSFMLSAVMLNVNINLTQVSAGQVLYGDYVLISNTSLDPNEKEPTGVMEFDDLGVYTTQQLNANAYKDMVACRPTTVYDGSGSRENVSAQTGNTKTHSVGEKSSFKHATDITCVGVGEHCYVWMDSALYSAYGDTNRQTVAEAVIKTFDEYSYDDYLKEYNYDKYIRYYDNSDKLSIVFVNESISASGYFASSPTETAIYIPRSADSVKTQTANEIKKDIYSEGVLYAHEAQHAMAYSQGRIYGLWLNEGLSVSIMSNRDDWITGFQNNSNIAGGAPVICNSGEDHDSVYVLSHLFLRYLNVQANGGRYLHSDNVVNTADIEAYQKFYSYFYTTNVPENLTENSKDIYIIEYLMQDYHKQDARLFANSDGSCWDFNDALRNFRLAVMMQNDSGIYSYGTPGISDALPYYPVYSGSSGKSISIPGTGAVIVKTQNGRFEVPEIHGSHIEYVSFNCNKKLNDGTNILKIPEKDFYVTGDKYTSDGIVIGQTNNGVNSVYTSISQLNSIGLYVCMLDEKHTNETFRLVTDGMTMNVPYPTNESENFMVFLCYSEPTDFNSFLNTPKELLYRLTVAEKGESEITVPVTDSEGYYKIFNKEQFEWFTSNSSMYNSIKARLMADIVLNTGDVPSLAKSGNTASLSNWEPKNIVGELDGQGHCISGLYSSGTSFRGLFSSTAGNIHDLGIVNSYIESTDNRAGTFAVGMVTSNASITNCYTDAWVKGAYSCGGIINYGYGVVKNCVFVGTLDNGSYYRYPMGEYVNAENSYYISGCGNNESDGQGTALSAARFISGEAAYLLNTKGDAVWFQNIDNGEAVDSYPVLDSDHGTVYKVTNGYSNDPKAVLETSTETTTETTTTAYVNGFADDGSYQPAELKQGWYEIGNAGQLYWFENFAYENSSIKGRLVNDIVVNDEDVISLAKAGTTDGLRRWLSIGRDKSFSGEFDGQGHYISGLYCIGYYNNYTTRYCGFTSLLNGTVKNLGIVNSYFKTNYNSQGYCGTIAGYVTGGMIENCYSDSHAESKYLYGGITAYLNQSTMKNCYSCGEDLQYALGYVGTSSTAENNYYVNGYQISGGTQVGMEQIASGEVAYNINRAAGKTIYYQNIDNGKTKDSAPMLDSTHGVVYYKGGKYTNINSASETSTESTTAEVSQQTTNYDGYDENGLDINGNYQPAVYKNGAYEIGNMGQLYWYADYINNQSGNRDGRLVADIVVNSGKMISSSKDVRKWIPIGNATGHTEGVFYKNTFDGQGHYISGLYCDVTFFAGLFGCLSGGTVKNVGVINSYLTATKGAGAIAGGGSDLTTGGTVSGCYSAYNVMYAQDNAGGIVGGAWKGTKIQNCFCAYCDLTAYNTSQGEAFTGPMAGYIAINENASTSGGKYTGIRAENAFENFYGDSSSKEYYSGDSNLDGKTDILDAVSALEVGFTYGSFASYTTDINNDQKITKADTAAILKYLGKQ